MMFIFFCLFYSCVVVIAQASDKDAKEVEFTSLFKQSVPIETNQLRHFYTKFAHHAEAISALEAGQKGFEISDNQRSFEGWNFSK